jgi:hypothetical protein
VVVVEEPQTTPRRRRLRTRRRLVRLGRGYVQAAPGRPNRHPLAAASSFTRARRYHNSATSALVAIASN